MEQFGRKMNQDVSGNKMLFWKEVSQMGKLKSCSRIKDGSEGAKQCQWEMRKCEELGRCQI